MPSEIWIAKNSANIAQRGKAEFQTIIAFEDILEIGVNMT